MLDKGIKSRKFIIASAIIVIDTICLFAGVITPDHWTEVVKFDISMYLGAKAIEAGLKKIPLGQKKTEEISYEKQSN